MTFILILLGVFAVIFVAAMFMVDPEKLEKQTGKSGTIKINNPTVTSFEMPDIGVSGTASESQKKSLEKTLGAPVDDDISSDQASLMLDARQYARGLLAEFERGGVMIDEDTGTRTVMFFILSNPEIRDYVGKWGRGRFERGTHHDTPRLPKNPNYQQVFDYLAQQAGAAPKSKKK